MIFCASASPMPGSVINSNLGAELISTRYSFFSVFAVLFFSVGFGELAVDWVSFRVSFVCPKAEPATRHRVTNRTNRSSRIFLFIRCSLCGRLYGSACSSHLTCCTSTIKICEHCSLRERQQSGSLRLRKKLRYGALPGHFHDVRAFRVQLESIGWDVSISVR